MPTIARGVLLWALILIALFAIIRWWTKRGHSLIGCLGLLVAIVAAGVGCIVLLARFQSEQNAQGWALMARTAAAMKHIQDSARTVQLHAWCETWAGTAVPDSACAQWSVDTAPPASLGEPIHLFARRRFADSLAAAAELATLSRDVGSARVEVAGILPAWNRWARAHPSADHFGRFQAAHLVFDSCARRQPHADTVGVNTRSAPDHTDWCARTWQTDSMTFAASALPSPR
jgi:hypothetical protein